MDLSVTFEIQQDKIRRVVYAEQNELPLKSPPCCTLDSLRDDVMDGTVRNFV